MVVNKIFEKEENLKISIHGFAQISQEMALKAQKFSIYIYRRFGLGKSAYQNLIFMEKLNLILER